MFRRWRHVLHGLCVSPGVTNNADIARPLRPEASPVAQAPLLGELAKRPGPVDRDTAAALGAGVVGALSVIVSAVALIHAYVAPSGAFFVVVAAIVAAAIACALLVGGVHAWMRDRGRRSR